MQSLSQALNPIASFAASLLSNHVFLPDIKAEAGKDKKFNAVRTQIQQATIEANNPAFKNSLEKLETNLDKLDDLTHEMLLSESNQATFIQFAGRIFDFVNKKVCPFIVQARSANADYSSINEQYLEIIADAEELKQSSQEFPKLWKDTAWKNLMLVVGIVAFCAFGGSITAFSAGIAATWLIYEVYFNVRKDLFEQAVKLIDEFKAQAEKENLNASTLAIKKGQLDAKKAEEQSQSALRQLKDMAQKFENIESQNRKNAMRKLALIEKFENRRSSSSNFRDNIEQTPTSLDY